MIAIFRARRDPALATRLAARLARGQLLDRLSAPLLVPQLLLGAVAIVCALLVIAALIGAVTLHWSAAIPAIIPLAVGVLAVVVLRGLRAGLARVRDAAERLTETGMDRVLPVPPDADQPTPAPDLPSGAS